MSYSYTYSPKRVCSRQLKIKLYDKGKILSANFTGGCNGNTNGISALVRGMYAEDAIKRLKGIDCNGRGTSCPDQLAIALEKALEEF